MDKVTLSFIVSRSSPSRAGHPRGTSPRLIPPRRRRRREITATELAEAGEDGKDVYDEKETAWLEHDGDDEGAESEVEFVPS